MKRAKSDRGFSLIELLVAIAIALIVLGAGFQLFKKGMDLSLLASGRAEMQANARVGINAIARDLSQAGASGYPFGGIPLPNDAAPPAFSRFGIDTAGIVELTPALFLDRQLFAVTPAPAMGPTPTTSNPVVASDGINIVYVDQALVTRTTPPGGCGAALTSWRDVNPAITAPVGGTATAVMPACTNPPVNDPVNGIRVGDVMMFSNQNGNAVGEVTGVAGNALSFAAGDALNINISNTASGNIKAISNNPANALPASFPPTTVVRLLMVTYFLQASDVNGNRLAIGAPGAVDYTLMRQVNAQPAVAVAEHIFSLKFSYDVIDAAGNATSASPDATPGGTRQFAGIRNVYVTVTTRSPRPLGNNQYAYSTMFTNVSPRNLSYTPICATAC